MSSVASAPGAMPSGNCAAGTYVIPTSEPACAMVRADNHTEIMSECCSGPVVGYGDNCGIYCTADEGTEQLLNCLYDNGAAHGNQLFCNNATADATASGNGGATSATASTSVVASGTGGASSDNDDDDDDDSNGNSGNGNSDSNSDSDSDDGDDSAAAGFNVVGAAVSALLVTATAFGSFLL